MIRHKREEQTVEAIITIYCKRHHGTLSLCKECLELRDYCWEKLSYCRHGYRKPTCGRCKIHCYKPAMKKKIKEVMKYAGPRMLVYHPLLAFYHLLHTIIGRKLYGRV